ncbi:DUF2929 family protein [Virgibacillus soli]|uniref:DUF2929 family protein n=1 Tax=Paracerasibacillus soli TaxID=480284 RepID=A0ABU5CPX9_9BACI|nr:DUF2929 family protein [Virgibacillus soli]MDY0407877.1 DUF2929 family protein [Virgibacillus soli]
MRYIMTIIWAFIISTVVSYVLSSMAGEGFAMNGTVALAAVFIVAIFILGGILRDNHQEN